MPVVASALSPNLSRHRVIRKPAVKSTGGIVVSQNRAASEIGARVLKADGHAADAAVATAFALGILEPWMSGIGGVGAALVYDAKADKVTGVDFGGRSPKGLKPEDFPLLAGADGDLFGWPLVKENRNTVGAKATVAPTEPAGLDLLHRTFGRAKWADLMAPAIALAEQGPVVDWHTTLMVAGAFADLNKDPGARARFLPGGAPPVPPPAAAPKTVLHLPMPTLAASLKLLATEGAKALYHGPLARSIAADVQAMGGYLTEADLAAVAPRLVTPLEIAYQGRTIHVLPELNGGPTLAHAFSHLNTHRPMPAKSPDGATFAAYAAALQQAWAWRLEHMGDNGERTAPTSTTHLAVIDRDGNIVTLTQTLLSLFGSRIVLPGSGIMMNNGINWFNPVPGGPNAIAPDARVLANYAPAIMTGGGRTMGLGGCGGRKILPAVFQLLGLSADFGMDLDTAFHQPRLDVPNATRIVTDRRMPQAMLDALEAQFDCVSAEPVVSTNPYTIASAVARTGTVNEGATEPDNPWSEAVSEDEV
jgi:gamma-glutamyltranspeptidase / glutathione hydrolase